MSDVQDYPPEEQQETQVVVSPIEAAALAEVIKQAGNPEAAMNELSTTFNILYQASDADKQKVIMNAWGLVQRVHNAVGVSFALLVGTREIAAELESQNLALMDEYERVRLGLEDPDASDHPLVLALVEKIRDWEGEAAADRYEMMFEDWKNDQFDRLADDAQEFADETIRDEIDDEIAEALDISSFEAHDVIEILRGNEGKLTDEECRSLLTWVNSVEERLQRERMARREAYTS